MLFGSIQSSSTAQAPVLRLPSELSMLWDEVHIGELWKQITNRGDIRGSQGFAE